MFRYKYMDGELGIVVEPEFLPEDIYPFSLVEDTDLNIRGSCLSYYSRSRICLMIINETVIHYTMR